jgi:hypothetical protein
MNTDFTDDELALDAEIQDGEYTGSRAKDIFCNQWDSARIGLSTLQLLLQKKMIVSFVIGIVITIGDKISLRFCVKD